MYKIVLPLTLLLYLASCSDNKSVAPVLTPSLADTLTVSFGQSVDLAGTTLSLHFDKVLFDGRLPTGVMNPQWWFNTAQTQWTVLPSGKKIQLYISGEIHDSAGVHFEGGSVNLDGYSFRLTHLDPLPTQLFYPVPESELVAVIKFDIAGTPPVSDSGCLPMALGNRWIYLDSSFLSDTLVAVKTDTFSIIDEYTDVYGQWWTWSYPLNTMGRISKVVIDTIYSQQDAYGPSKGGRPKYYPAREFIPPVGDSSTFTAILGGDAGYFRSAKRMYDPIVTPAGSFENGIMYASKIGNDKDWEVLARGVGFVYLRKDHTYFSIPSTSNHLWLISYDLH